MKEGIDFLYCNICLSLTGNSKEYQSVGYHLKGHNVTSKKYREMFQGCPTHTLIEIERISKSRLKYYKTDRGKKYKELLRSRTLSNNPMHNPVFRKNFDIAVQNPERKEKIRKHSKENKPYWFLGVAFDSEQERKVVKLISKKLGIIPIEGVNCHIAMGNEIDFYIFGFFWEHHPMVKLWDGEKTVEDYYRERRKILDDNGFKKYSLKVTNTLEEAQQFTDFLRKL